MPLGYIQLSESVSEDVTSNNTSPLPVTFTFHFSYMKKTQDQESDEEEKAGATGRDKVTKIVLLKNDLYI